MAEAKVKSNGLVKLRASDEDVRLDANTSSSCGYTVTKSLTDILFAKVTVRYEAEIRQFKGNGPVPAGWTRLSEVSFYNGYKTGKSPLAVKITVKSVDGMQSLSNTSTISDNWSFSEKVRTTEANDRTTWGGSISNIANAIKGEYDGTGLNFKILQALQRNPSVLIGTPEYSNFYHKAIVQKFGPTPTYVGRKKRLAAVKMNMTSEIRISAQNSINALTKKGGNSGSGEANSQMGISLLSRPMTEWSIETPPPEFELEKATCGTWYYLGEESGAGLVLYARPYNETFAEIVANENRKWWEGYEQDQIYLAQQRASGAANQRLTTSMIRDLLGLGSGGGGGPGPGGIWLDGSAAYLGPAGYVGDTYVVAAVKAPFRTRDRTKYDICVTMGIEIGTDDNGDPVVSTISFFAESRYLPTADDVVKAAIRNAPWLIEQIGGLVTNKNKSMPQKVQEAKAAVTNAVATNAITPGQGAATNNWIDATNGVMVSDYNGLTLGQQIGRVTNGVTPGLAITTNTVGPGPSSGGGELPPSPSGAPADGGVVGIGEAAAVNAQTNTLTPTNGPNPSMGTTTNNSSLTIPDAPTNLVASPPVDRVAASAATNVVVTSNALAGQVGGAGGTNVETPNPDFQGTEEDIANGTNSTIGGTVVEAGRPEATNMVVAEGTNAAAVVSQLPPSQGATEPALDNPSTNNALGPPFGYAGVVLTTTNYVTEPPAGVTPSTSAQDRVPLPGVVENAGNRPLHQVRDSDGHLVGSGGTAAVNESVIGGGSGRVVVIFSPPFDVNTVGTPVGEGVRVNLGDDVLQVIFEDE